MNVDEKNELNKKVLEYIAVVKKREGAPLWAPPDSEPHPYMNAGSHPDVVERVWKGLGSSLPEDCRCMVLGTPALVHPKTGIILAFCNGTSYCLRISKLNLEEALKAGAKTTQEYFGGRTMDSQRQLGPDWVFGSWQEAETAWCRHVYDELQGTLSIAV